MIDAYYGYGVRMTKTKILGITTGGRVRWLRVHKQLSQDELAQRAGIDRKTVNRIENGHFSPSLDTLFRLCKALKVKPADFVGGIKKH